MDRLDKPATSLIVVLGDGGVGKTAMIIRVALQHFVPTYDPTVEDSYRKQVLIDSQPCMLDLLDTAGQEEYTALRAQWIRDADLFMVVYSISSRSSFTRSQRFVNQIRTVKQSAIESSARGADIGNPGAVVPICLVGNQSDRVTEREVSTQEGMALSKELECDIFLECSAKNHVNIEKAFYDLVRVYWRKQRESRLEDKPSFYPTRQSLWRKKLMIPPNESGSEAGRVRLTKSLVNSAKANHERETLAFLEAGAQVNGQPGSDGAAIHAAAAAGHPNIVNILIKNGAAINAKGPAGTSALQLASVEGHLAVVKLLIHKGAQINQTSQLHGTALSAAASRGRLLVVEYLLKKKADVNIDGGPFGNALQAAAWVGKVPIVEALLSAGADINARGEGYCTALQIAAFAGHARVIRTLLSRGGTINIDDSLGKYGCALKAADDHGHFEAVKILLEAGARSTIRIRSEEVTEEQRTSVDLREASSPNHQNDEVVVLSQPTIKADLAIPSSRLMSLPDAGEYHAPHQRSYSTSNTMARPAINAVGFSTILSPVDAKIDIVFVHGLQGHPETTWTYFPSNSKRRLFRKSSVDLSKLQQGTVFWPYDLLSNYPGLEKARVLTWGYDTKVVEFFGAVNQQKISQHGNDLMVSLQQERKLDPSRPLIFVAHSLGGILVKVALDESRRSTHQPLFLDIYNSTRGVIFLGTPHGGSDTANWGVLASNLTKLALQGPSTRVLKALSPNNELLENLRKAFLQMLEDNKFQIHSFYETQPMLGVYGLQDRVVPYSSALVGHARQEVVRGINGNHSEICKFSGMTDPGFRAVVGALEDYVQGCAGGDLR